MLSFHLEDSSVHTFANYLVWLVSPSPCPVPGTVEPFMGIIKQNPCLLWEFFLDFCLVFVDVLSSFWDPGSCLYVLMCEFVLMLFMAVFEIICTALALVLVADLNVYNLDVIVVLRWKSNCTFTCFQCYCLQYIFTAGWTRRRWQFLLQFFQFNVRDQTRRVCNRSLFWINASFDIESREVWWPRYSISRHLHSLDGRCRHSVFNS